jgi:hypothetical protein
VVSKVPKHTWAFKPRFRRRSFGWRSQPAIQRIKEAVTEIRKVARTDQVLAAEGAVSFLDRVSAAIEQVDGSSGAIGTAVNNAIDQLVPIIAGAPADAQTRDGWLERLFEAHANDDIPYIESLAESWGDLCASPAIASAWADRLIGIVKMAWSSDPNLHGFFHGTDACLSALFACARYDELLALLQLQQRPFWPYQEWGVRALAAQGRTDDALAMAESFRDPYTSDIALARCCEQILLARGDVEAAYQRYGLTANQAITHLARFRAIVRKYPHKEPREILLDLARSTPGEEGKWFAAAKDAGLFAEALTLACQSPPDPKVLARAARDFAETRPQFAADAGLAALHWIALGYGYDIDSSHVRMAHDWGAKAAANVGAVAVFQEALQKIEAMTGEYENFVAKILQQDRKRGVL